jgi:hypothetical protein
MERTAGEATAEAPGCSPQARAARGLALRLHHRFFSCRFSPSMALRIIRAPEEPFISI